MAHNQICQRIPAILGEASRLYIQAIVVEGAVMARGVIYSAGTTHAAPGGCNSILVDLEHHCLIDLLEGVSVELI